MSSGALYGALPVQKNPSEPTSNDPDLMLIQNRWPTLPEHIKAAVLTLVRASGGR